MIAVGRGKVSLCEGVTRREWLRLGGLGAFGLSLPTMLEGQAAAQTESPTRPRSFGRARSCILAFLFGAPAHQDLWDMKPDAPAEYRGEFRPARTRVAGMELCELIPRLGEQAHHLSILRSVAHSDNTHTVAMHYMLTGYRHAEPQTNPQNKPNDFPTFGAVMQYLHPPVGSLPPGISLNSPANQVSANNHIFPGFFAGFLGSRYDPLFISDDPSKPEFKPFRLAEGLTTSRLDRRRTLLDGFDRQWHAVEPYVAARQLTEHQQRAFNLTTSSAARTAFDLSLEPARVRERYGMHPFGQGLLLARRLAQAGVPLITVNWMRDDAFWDTHSDNFKRMRDLLPPFDLAFSALLEDLSSRGMLDETLVVCLGEFGRTPQINKSAGRDHWADCNSVVFAGGGVKGGQIHGASDKIAAYPVTPPIYPEDLAATIYHALGVDPRTELRDPLNRPLPLTTGRPLLELFS